LLALGANGWAPKDSRLYHLWRRRPRARHSIDQLTMLTRFKVFVHRRLMSVAIRFAACAEKFVPPTPPPTSMPDPPPAESTSFPRFTGSPEEAAVHVKLPLAGTTKRYVLVRIDPSGAIPGLVENYQL